MGCVMGNEHGREMSPGEVLAADEARVIRALTRVSKPSSDFDLNPGVNPPDGVKLRPAAVLITLLASPNGTQVILTKRSSALKHHPGQISFPGGAIDAQDASPADAALREAWEEIGMPVTSAGILGQLPNHQTVTGFQVTPVIVSVRDAFEPKPEPGEVAEVFMVPLNNIVNPAAFQVQSRIWQGVSRRYQTVPYGPYYIWGATARILKSLADGMHS